MKKLFIMVLFLFLCLSLYINCQAKETKWGYLKCEQSSKVICNLYSTNTARYPNTNYITFDISTDNLEFENFKSNISSLSFSNNKFTLKLDQTLKKDQLLGTISFKIVNKNNDASLKVNRYNYYYSGNNDDNSNYLFIGDSFFDMLDGVNINRNSSTIIDSGYFNHTDNDYYRTNGRRQPTLGKIHSLGISGSTTLLFATYFTNPNNNWITSNLPDFYLPNNVNKVVIYLGTNDASKYLDGDSSYDETHIKQYMDTIIKGLNSKYNSPTIYILRVFSRPSVNSENSIINKYNIAYSQLANQYSNVNFINTEYLNNYTLTNESGIIRDNYYAFYTKNGYGYGGHFTVDAYDLFVDSIITSLNLNYETVDTSNTFTFPKKINSNNNNNNSNSNSNSNSNNSDKNNSFNTSVNDDNNDNNNSLDDSKEDDENAPSNDDNKSDDENNESNFLEINKNESNNNSSKEDATKKYNLVYFIPLVVILVIIIYIIIKKRLIFKR